MTADAERLPIRIVEWHEGEPRPDVLNDQRASTIHDLQLRTDEPVPVAGDLVLLHQPGSAPMRFTRFVVLEREYLCMTSADAQRCTATWLYVRRGADVATTIGGTNSTPAFEDELNNVLQLPKVPR